MNKRDFILQGGTTLLGSSTMGSTWAMRTTPSSPQDTALATSGSARSHWLAMVGQHFHGLTNMGRPVTLTLQAVHDHTSGHAANSLEQFTVIFRGPRSLPLKPGLHELTHPEAGTVHLYLEPVPLGEQFGYNAHFSLLS